MKVLVLAVFVVCGLALATAKNCGDAGDCEKGECCVGYRPNNGLCRPLSKEGKTCLIKRTDFFGDFNFAYCPCEEGLECVKPEDSKSKDKNDGVCTKPPTTTAEPVTEAATTQDSGSNSSEDSNEHTTVRPDSNENSNETSSEEQKE